MRTALAFWRRSRVSASTSARVHYRPDEINWMHVALKFGLGLLLLGNLAAPFAARAQNLGTSPQFGQAVQGQQATTVEGTVLNIVNWDATSSLRSSPWPAWGSPDGTSRAVVATWAGASPAWLSW
jgi:hypothetical protein